MGSSVVGTRTRRADRIEVAGGGGALPVGIQGIGANGTIVEELCVRTVIVATAQLEPNLRVKR